MFAREEQSHVDWNSAEYRLLDGRQSFFGARDLDEHVRATSARVQLFGNPDGRFAVMRKQCGYLERNEAVDTASSIVNRTEQIGRSPDIIQGHLVEQRFA